jgi:AcrR family transcriptional regulator
MDEPRSQAVAGDAFAYATARLSPTARRILTAAHRVLLRDGYEALTLRRIGVEAGETKSLIIYHFDSKAGLVATLVDSLWHDADVALVDDLRGPPDGISGHARELIGLHRDLALQTSLYATYFDLLPHILRDRDARRRLAQFYDSYRRLGAMCLESSVLGAGDVRQLTTLLLGIGEGVAAQALLDPETTDTEGTFALLYDLLQAALGGEVSENVARLREAVAAGCTTPDLTADDPDPVEALSPVAANLLTAAQRVLLGQGLRALTLDAIAERAGEPRSAVSYYFGDKRGLIDRLHAATLHAERALVRRAVKRLPEDAARVPAVIAAQEPMLMRPSTFRRHYELLPAVLRDETLKARQVAQLRWVRTTMATCLAGSSDPAQVSSLESLASLAVAAPSGIAIQRLVARDDVAPAPLLELWGRVVVDALQIPVAPE